jgi:hypothetical protein
MNKFVALVGLIDRIHNAMAALIEKAIVVDENTVEVVWENQDMYDKLLAQIQECCAIIKIYILQAPER